MPKFKALPPLEELQKEFNYDPETGLFTHAYYKSGRAKAGSRAGAIRKDGYITIGYKNTRCFLAHRLAWVFISGNDPGDLLVDHIDRVTSNNSASNLRLVTRDQNQWNRVGRGWKQNGKKYEVQLSHKKEIIYIGLFASAEEAEAAYRSKARELRGEFAPDYD